MNCKCCGQPLIEYRQDSVTLAECRNPNCEKRDITLPLDQYESADLSLYHQPKRQPVKRENPFAGKIFGEE